MKDSERSGKWLGISNRPEPCSSALPVSDPSNQPARRVPVLPVARFLPSVRPGATALPVMLILLLILLLTLPLAAACQAAPVVGDEDNEAPIALLHFEDIGDGISGVVYRRINSFDAFLAQSEVPVLLVFYNPLGDINHLVIPRIEQLADEYRGRLALVWINTTEAVTLARNFGVEQLPQFTMVVDAAVKRTLVGYDDQGAANLAELIAPYVS